MLFTTSLKPKSILYDVELHGGVGTINTGLWFPANTCAGFLFCVKLVTAFTANAGALISGGTLIAPAAFFTPLDFTILPVQQWSAIVTNPFYNVSSPGEEFILTITINNYLTGRMIANIITLESPE